MNSSSPGWSGMMMTTASYFVQHSHFAALSSNVVVLCSTALKNISLSQSSSVVWTTLLPAMSICRNFAVRKSEKEQFHWLQGHCLITNWNGWTTVFSQASKRVKGRKRSCVTCKFWDKCLRIATVNSYVIPIYYASS